MRIPKEIKVEPTHIIAGLLFLVLGTLVMVSHSKITSKLEAESQAPVVHQTSEPTPFLDKVFEVEIGTTLEEAKRHFGDPARLYYNIKGNKQEVRCSWKHGKGYIVVEFINGKAVEIYNKPE